MSFLAIITLFLLVLLFFAIHLLLLLLKLFYIFLGQFSQVFSFFPNTHAWHSILFSSVNACAILLSIEPLACVNSAIGPLEGSLTMLRVILEISFVLFAVWPDELSIAMHLVFNPRAEVNSTVGPLVLALTMNLVVQPFSFVHASVTPNVASHSVL